MTRLARARAHAARSTEHGYLRTGHALAEVACPLCRDRVQANLDRLPWPERVQRKPGQIVRALRESVRLHLLGDCIRFPLDDVKRNR